MAKTKSRVQRTLERIRRRGQLVAVAEHWNPFVPRPGGGRGIRQDLFGFIDLVVLDVSRGRIVAIQVCGGGDAAAHRRKLLGPRQNVCVPWLMCGGEIELWIWRKLKKGKRAVWSEKVEVLGLEDFEVGKIML